MPAIISGVGGHRREMGQREIAFLRGCSQEPRYVLGILGDNEQSSGQDGPPEGTVAGHLPDPAPLVGKGCV